MNRKLAFIAIAVIASPVKGAEMPGQTGSAVNYSELNIREHKAKSLPLSQVLTINKVKPERIVFDQGYRGRICLFSCHFYDGYTSRWSSYSLDLQPYESTCSALAGGCTTTTFPRPDSEIIVLVGGKEYKASMTDEQKYRYYLPLALRQAIVQNESFPITIRTKWDKYRDYKIGNKTRPLLTQVLDSATEVEVEASTSARESSTEERINELNKLREKGLISEDEYRKMRQKALGL